MGREHAIALDRLRAAMTAYPENVAGHGQLVTDLMALSDGRIVAKSGAEGLICLAVPERDLGIAIRVLDGGFRTHAAVTSPPWSSSASSMRPLVRPSWNATRPNCAITTVASWARSARPFNWGEPLPSREATTSRFSPRESQSRQNRKLLERTTL